MAVEAQSQKHVIIRPQNPPVDVDFDDLLQQTTSRKINARLFNHHYLHDLESLWWIAVWAIFTTREKSDEQFTLCDTFDEIFPHRMNDIGDRMNFLMDEDTFLRNTAALPRIFEKIYSKLNALRMLLIYSYGELNKYLKTREEFPLDMLVKAYDLTIKGYEMIAEVVDDAQVLVPATRHRLVAKRKREAEDEGSKSSHRRDNVA